MSFRDCITSAIADGHISRDAGTEYIARYDELAEAIGGGSGKSWYEAKTEAAVRLQGEIERKLRRKKRMRLFHASPSIVSEPARFPARSTRRCGPSSISIPSSNM